MNIVTRNDVYNAPTIPWNSETYTPVSNKFIMDTIETKIRSLGLMIRNESHKATISNNQFIKGVICSYNIATSDSDFGQKIMFRNSYDKSMSFALACGTIVWICENGALKGDYQFKRIHRGVIEDDWNTTMQAVVENIDKGFTVISSSFETITRQLRELQHFEISPKESYEIIGKLFFEKKVINITQLSAIKREFEFSTSFRHLGDINFTAYDLYNSITEALKLSHPLNYFDDHIVTHSLFEEVFHI